MSRFVLMHGAWLGAWCWDEVAERIPERIDTSIYLAAYLLRLGESIAQVSQTAADSLVGPNMVPAPDWSTISIRPDALRGVFAADAPPAAIRRLQSMARPGPGAPFNTQIHVTCKNFGQVPRDYIRTAADRAVIPALQGSMLQNTPCADVITLSTSHTPFFSAPSELAASLIQLASHSMETGPR